MATSPTRPEARPATRSVPARYPILALLPFLVLPFILTRLGTPDGKGFPTSTAVAASAFVLALSVAHAWSGERGFAGSRQRVFVNEGLARALFLGFCGLVVGLYTDLASWFLAMTAPWAVLTWIVHADQVKKEGYLWQSGTAILGLYVLGVALIVLVLQQAS